MAHWDALLPALLKALSVSYETLQAPSETLQAPSESFQAPSLAIQTPFEVLPALPEPTPSNSVHKVIVY